MRTYTIVTLIFFALIILLGLAWYFWGPIGNETPASPVPGYTPSLPVGSVQPSSQPGSTSTATDSVVAADFTSQIQNADQIQLKETVVVSRFALQTWGDENKGGEALLEYTNDGHWKLLSMGGGAWTVSALIQEGVPQMIAEQLVSASSD